VHDSPSQSGQTHRSQPQACNFAVDFTLFRAQQPVAAMGGALATDEGSQPHFAQSHSSPTQAGHAHTAQQQPAFFVAVDAAWPFGASE